MVFVFPQNPRRSLLLRTQQDPSFTTNTRGSWDQRPPPTPQGRRRDRWRTGSRALGGRRTAAWEPLPRRLTTYGGRRRLPRERDDASAASFRAAQSSGSFSSRSGSGTFRDPGMEATWKWCAPAGRRAAGGARRGRAAACTLGRQVTLAFSGSRFRLGAGCTSNTSKGSVKETRIILILVMKRNVPY